MALTININNLTLCHKGSNGITTATIPDVCKTPSPGGPVPIPYPNIAMSSDLMKGTTTVKADGGMMCANYGSEFFKSTGDEPGTLGGVVSSTFIKEATWMTFSFDVKLEGKAACRLTDKMFHNHMNTVNMAGLLQPPLPFGPPGPETLCEKLAREINEMVNRAKGPKDGGTKGLKQRFTEQINGKNGPPGSGVGDSGVWDTHDKAIKEQQKGLRDRLNDYNKNNCGDPIPVESWEWATRPAPSPKEWKNPVPVAEPSSRTGFWNTMRDLTGLTGTALVLYVIVSEGSRLFPPRNLVPVP